MTDHDSNAPLTPKELAALADFDDRLEAELEPGRETAETKEKKMSPVNLVHRWITAAGVAAAFVGLLTVLWNAWDDGSSQGPRQAPQVVMSFVQEESKPHADETRVSFLVGLPFEGGRRAALDLTPPDTKPSGQRVFVFELDKAEQQREEAIKKGTGKPDGYRDGTRFQLADAKGRPLPVYWMPWIPKHLGQRLGISVSKVEQALGAARKGEAYDRSHVVGHWLYADPAWFTKGQLAFEGRFFQNVRQSTDQLGQRCVTFEIAAPFRKNFTEYTGKYIERELCLVVGDMVWSNPTVKQALHDAVQISGGGSGFSTKEVKLLINALTQK